MREWSQRLIFHIALTMGGCYMAMVLTAWDTTGMHAGNADMAAFWIKLGKSCKSERATKKIIPLFIIWVNHLFLTI